MKLNAVNKSDSSCCQWPSLKAGRPSPAHRTKIRSNQA